MMMTFITSGYLTRTLLLLHVDVVLPTRTLLPIRSSPTSSMLRAPCEELHAKSSMLRAPC